MLAPFTQHGFLLLQDDETAWRVRNVEPDPYSLDRVIITGCNGEIRYLNIREYVRRVIES